MAKRNITLHYFDTKGIGEPTRLLLAAGGIEFKDARYSLEGFMENSELKERLPFGQVPALEVDGVVLGQKESIARFAAKLAGLYPQDPVDATRVDMIVVHCNDTLAETTKMIFDGVPGAPGTTMFSSEQRDKMVARWRETRMPDQVGRLESLAEGATMVGNAMTWADVCVFNFFDRLRDLMPDLSLEPWPKLAAVCETVTGQPGIQEWMRAHSELYPSR